MSVPPRTPPGPEAVSQTPPHQNRRGFACVALPRGHVAYVPNPPGLIWEAKYLPGGVFRQK